MDARRLVWRPSGQSGGPSEVRRVLGRQERGALVGRGSVVRGALVGRGSPESQVATESQVARPNCVTVV